MVGVSAGMQWGLGAGGMPEEDRETEALRKRPRPRRGLRAVKSGGPFVLHMTVAQPKVCCPKKFQSLLLPDRKKHPEP